MKNIVILGGSLGIGFAAAKELVAAGNCVLLVGRSEEHLTVAKQKLEALAGVSGEQVLTLSVDISDPCAAGVIAASLRENERSLDGLILNAAAFGSPETKKSVIQPEAEELSYILERNVVTQYRLVRELLPQLEAAKGRIVLIGSTAGIRNDKGGIYGISKWALRGYAYNLRDEARKYGVGVSLVNPGGTFTERRAKTSEEDRRLLETSDLGKVIAMIFTLSQQAVVEQIDIRPISGDTY